MRIEEEKTEWKIWIFAGDLRFRRFCISWISETEFDFFQKTRQFSFELENEWELSPIWIIKSFRNFDTAIWRGLIESFVRKCGPKDLLSPTNLKHCLKTAESTFSKISTVDYWAKIASFFANTEESPYMCRLQKVLNFSKTNTSHT